MTSYLIAIFHATYGSGKVYSVYCCPVHFISGIRSRAHCFCIFIRSLSHLILLFYYFNTPRVSRNFLSHLNCFVPPHISLDKFAKYYPATQLYLNVNYFLV